MRKVMVAVVWRILAEASFVFIHQFHVGHHQRGAWGDVCCRRSEGKGRGTGSACGADEMLHGFGKHFLLLFFLLVLLSFILVVFGLLKRASRGVPTAAVEKVSLRRSPPSRSRPVESP